MGLTLFIKGLELGLFPLGETMALRLRLAQASVVWLLAFAFALGFGTTVAEPALIAVAAEAASRGRRPGGRSPAEPGCAGKELCPEGLRLTVADLGRGGDTGRCDPYSQGLADAVSDHSGGCIGVVVMTAFAPQEIVGIAYDSGGVTTSTITVPLVTALGVGLASSIKGRNPMIDGFGLIAFASLTPMIFVMVYGMLLCEGEPMDRHPHHQLCPRHP